MTDALRLLDALLGQWQLSRVIEQEGATMQGTAQFTRAAPHVLDYTETGVLALRGGQTLRCVRRYRYTADEQSLVIAFRDGPDEGKTFVTLRFHDDAVQSVVADDTHHCGNDIYSVRFRLQLPTSYATEIDVTGPRKNYRAVTRYTRLDALA